jgi:hypothetical protein
VTSARNTAYYSRTIHSNAPSGDIGKQQHKEFHTLSKFQRAFISDENVKKRGNTPRKFLKFNLKA